MYFDLPGKGLFVFSDPGGAKGILSYLVLHPQAEAIVISDREFDFYPDFEFNIRQYLPGMEDTVLAEYAPDFLLTATSYSSDIEKKFIKAATARRIKTISYVDHYTSYEERFVIDTQLCLPDVVLVIDDLAKEQLKAIFPGVEIVVTGNFYLEQLKAWRPGITKNEFYQKYQLRSNSSIFLLAPEPLSNVGGIGKYGIDELVFCKSIYPVLRGCIDNPNILLKLHPNQNLSYVAGFIADSMPDIKVLTDVDTKALLYYSDIIFGMFSNILLEANVFNKRIIRYLNGLKVPDPFAHTKVGEIVTETSLLKSVIKKQV